MCIVYMMYMVHMVCMMYMTYIAFIQCMYCLYGAGACEPHLAGGARPALDLEVLRDMLRSIFRISCLFLRPRLWQFEI